MTVNSLVGQQTFALPCKTFQTERLETRLIDKKRLSLAIAKNTNCVRFTLVHASMSTRLTKCSLHNKVVLKNDSYCRKNHRMFVNTKTTLIERLQLFKVT